MTKPNTGEPPTELPDDSLMPLESVLCTDELNRRPSRPPDYETENRALTALAQGLADSPDGILQTLADTILKVLQADSAGMSLLTKDGRRFEWAAIAGAWKPHLGGGTPRDFGPCGDVLDRNAPLLFKRWERRYPYLRAATQLAEEALLIPFYVHGKAVGTIWAVAHDDRRRFDAEDLRQLESLGRFASSAYEVVALRQSHAEIVQDVAEFHKTSIESQDSRRAALNLMEDAVQARQAMETLNGQLGESERRFREMIDALPAAVYTTDPEGRLTHFNPAAVEFAGRTPVLGVDEWCVSWKLFHADGTPMPHEDCPMAIALKEDRLIRGAEVMIERPDGTRLWFTPYPTPLRDTGGRIIGGINMLVDITERKRAEEVRARLATIVESSDDAIISHDLDGVITSWNQGAERSLGYTTEEAIGSPISILLPPECRDEESRIIERLRCQEVVEHYDSVSRRKDGTLLEVSVAVSPLMDGYSQLIGASRIFRDNSEHKDAQERLRQAGAELEGAVKAKTAELVQSHERLRAMATELNLTEQRERKRLAVEMHDNLAQWLVICCLNLGRVQRTDLSPKASQIVKETEEVLDKALDYSRTLMTELSPPILRDHGLPMGLTWLGEQMQRHGLTVRVDVGNRADLMLSDDCSVLLFQSVRELLMNALKHAKSKEVAIRLFESDGDFCVEVRDEGVGFDLAAADSTSTAMLSKFGLLSVRERMKALGGRFDLESSPGAGTTATLVLPVADSAECGTVLSAPVQDSGLSTQDPGLSTQESALRQDAKIRVLLVDDHAMVRQGLRAVLESYPDVEVVGEAWDGEEAVACVERLQPTIVVMDINMPKMNGIKATAQITSRFSDIIVIGLSVQAGGENEVAMRKAGASMLLTKEAAVEDLYRAIRETLGKVLKS